MVSNISCLANVSECSSSTKSAFKPEPAPSTSFNLFKIVVGVSMFPSLPSFPAGPVSPLLPLSPLGPVGPVGPVSPFGPLKFPINIF